LAASSKTPIAPTNTLAAKAPSCPDPKASQKAKGKRQKHFTLRRKARKGAKNSRAFVFPSLCPLATSLRKKSGTIQFRAQKQKHAHSHSISGHLDHRRTTRSGRALGIARNTGGGLRLPSGGLHVPRSSSRFRAALNLRHGQWRPVRTGLARQLRQFSSQHSGLSAH